MVRLIVAVLVLGSLSPEIAQACGADHDSPMQVQVRQTGPQTKIVHRSRPVEFIVFRGDMRMQNEEIRAERKEQKAAKQRQQQAQLEAPKAPKAAKHLAVVKKPSKANRSSASIGKKIVSMD